MNQYSSDVAVSTVPLFSFGTLMDADVLALVSAQALSTLRCEAASVEGFVQREVRGESFPVLERVANGRADGLLISGLTPLAWQRIMFFEGDEYGVQEIEVQLASGGRAKARYFVDASVYTLLPQSWSLQQWQQHDKPAFLPRCQHYMQFFGKLSTTEADAHW